MYGRTHSRGNRPSAGAITAELPGSFMWSCSQAPPAWTLNQGAGARRIRKRPAAEGNRHRGESVTQQTVARATNSVLVGARGASPEFAVRFAGALLAVAVAAVHVADQGGVTAMADPAWMGWAAGVLLGVGPFLGYVASRTVRLPGDPGDVGNWGYWAGTVSLLVEAALVMLSVSMLLA